MGEVEQEARGAAGPIDEVANAVGTVSLNETQPEADSSGLRADDEDAGKPADFLRERAQFFILTAAGKPVFSLHGTEEQLAEYGAIIQALVAYLDQDTHVLRAFRAPGALFVAKVEFPLILLAVDKFGQSEAQLRAGLDILHAQVLSTLTQDQLIKAFRKRPSMDLRPLLGGTEVFFRALARDMLVAAPALWLGALESLTLRKTLRTTVNNLLVEHRAPSLLYGLIMSAGRLVAVARPKRHSLHPPDLHLLTSMLFNTTAFAEGEHWVPICLPKFNPSGFLYAYVHFVSPETALVLISPDRVSFFDMQAMGATVLERLGHGKLLDPVYAAARSDRVRPADIGAPLVQHFVFKSRTNVQFLQSSFSPYFDTPAQQAELMQAYRRLQAFLHDNGLRIVHQRGERTTLFGWITPAFEIYCVTGPVTKESLSQSVRQILGWVRSREERLFIMGGATF